MQFHAGDFSLDDAPQSGSPVETDNNQIETLIENTQCYIMQEIADILKMSKSIKMLKMKNVSFILQKIKPHRFFWPTHYEEKICKLDFFKIKLSAHYKHYKNFSDWLHNEMLFATHIFKRDLYSKYIYNSYHLVMKYLTHTLLQMGRNIEYFTKEDVRHTHEEVLNITIH